ncbi:hypothetical protein [Mesorhizobium dulcispinae]|uniref:hypothetical protein n=1 Tax=Mesorhizobium dulcispinae TaxID=3072316 RepID=UPI002A2497C3|nr:hypothetical protein [Mesorhizobium sp. VK23D]MDX8522845.1 hypothetical protein [Mesorhizobium sp. VK23D]
MPKPHSSDGKEQLGGISKWATRTLRSLLVCGATSSQSRSPTRWRGSSGRCSPGRDISKYWRGEQRSTRLSRYDDQDGLADATPDRGEVQN